MAGLPPRRRRARARALPPAGVLAQHNGWCPRCDNEIAKGVHQVVRRGEDWIHTGCASGADDG